jgi:hypothetical protein
MNNNNNIEIKIKELISANKTDEEIVKILAEEESFGYEGYEKHGGSGEYKYEDAIITVKITVPYTIVEKIDKSSKDRNTYDYVSSLVDYTIKSDMGDEVKVEFI